jgi:hypothetical protein
MSGQRRELDWKHRVCWTRVSLAVSSYLPETLPALPAGPPRESLLAGLPALSFE